MSITVYTKDRCPKCHITKRFLTEHNIEYVEHNINQEPKALEHLKKLGYKQMPVVITNNDEWSSLNMKKLNNLKDAISN